MNEFPTPHPTEEDFVQASNIHRSETGASLLERPVAESLISQVEALLTPLDVRSKSEHGAVLIRSTNFSTFDHLLAVRKKIRDLELVPVRPNAVQEEYLRMSGETFLNVVRRRYLGKTAPMAMVREMYPSDSPDDVLQRVVWVRDDETSDREIARFIAGVMKKEGLGIDDIILFERSRVNNAPFVGVAVREHRHIHMWTRTRTG